MGRFHEFLARLRGAGTEADRHRLLAVLGLNRELAKAEGRRQLLTLLLDEAVRLFGAERGFLCVADAEGFRVEIARSLDREPIAAPERKVSGTVVRRALAGEGIFSADAQEGDLGPAQSIADLKLRSVIAMPLTVGSEVLGCLYLDHRFQSGVFDAGDLPWLQAFADQGAIVLHLHNLLAANRAQQQQLAVQNQQLAATVAAQAEELSELRPASRAELKHSFPALRGDSAALCRALQVLDRVVDGDFPVLLYGESGTGKELAARALHEQGPRRHGPFVAVNVAAIPGGLLESELFGHVQGAFTGAHRSRAGLLREASGGTLFLDEVTEMDLELQAKLLRAFEERAVRPLGADRSHPFDARIVAATNQEPAAAVSRGVLREDLYYRLAVVVVRLPPLRERAADIPLLARHFLDECAAARGLPPRELPPDLVAALLRRPFPGNLRELRNEMQRLLALCGEGPLQAAMLSPVAAAPDGVAVPLTHDLATIERWAIARALAAAGGNKAEAARLLGIARRTLYDKLAD